MKEIFFAPLQGFTDAAYRNAHHLVCGGVAAYYAPFLRLEHNEVRKRDVRDIDQIDHPLVPQVIAASAEEFKRLSSVLIDKGYRQIDINMGCPFPMQTRIGRGAGLLTQPHRVAEIMEEVRRLANQGIGFSVKMRLGESCDTEWQMILPILNQTPLLHITVHPRIAKQLYRGEVNIRAFAELYDSSEHPIIYNGDVLSVADMEHVVEQFPNLKGLMIGRGLLARPTLATEYLQGYLYSDSEVCERILDIHSKVLQHYMRTLEGGENQVLQKILPFWEYAGTLFAHSFLKQLKKSKSLQDYIDKIHSL